MLNRGISMGGGSRQMRRVGRRGSKEVREIAGWLCDEMRVSIDKSLLLFFKEWEHGGGERINGEGKGSRALRGRTELHDMIGLRRIRGMTIIHDNPVSLTASNSHPAQRCSCTLSSVDVAHMPLYKLELSQACSS